METELHSLYNVLKSYRSSLIKILSNIDDIMLQSVNTYGNSISVEKKYKLSLEMVKVLQTYVQMLFTSESLSEELKTKLANLEHDSQPERDRRLSNPFVMSLFNELRESHQPTTPSIPDRASTVEKILITTITQTQEKDPLCALETIALNSLDNNDEVDVKPQLDTDTKINIVEEAAANATSLVLKKPDDKVLVAVHETLDHEFPNKPSYSKSKSHAEKTQTKHKVTFAISPKKKSKQGESTTKEKLLKIVQDVQNQEVNEIDNSRKDFSLKSIALPKNQQSSPKTKEKNAVFAIVENELYPRMICVISYVVSPSEFYVRPNHDDSEQVENHFNEYLNDRYRYVRNSYKSKSEAEFHLSNFCFAFIRRKWYRIEVIDWRQDDPEMVMAQLIDYGEKYLLNYKDLKAMNELYASFPRMAVKCHLAYIQSTNPETKSKWGRASIDYFIQLTEMTKMTQFKLIYVYKDSDSYATDFIRLNEEDPDSLGELLVQAGYAFLPKIEGSGFSESDEDLEIDNINEAIAGYDARDEARICPFTDSSGRCFKGPTCRLEHGKLSDDGITTDKVPIMNAALVKFPLPAAGDRVEVVITGYIDTCHFYARFLQDFESDSLYNKNFKNLKRAMKANDAIQTYEPFKIQPTISELVLVRDELEWHRAICVGYVNGNKIEVFYVDYGYKRIKQLKDLRQMKEEFLHVPFQAIECILSDCQERKNVQIANSRDFFSRCMEGQKLCGLVVESNPEVVSLQLWDAEGLMLLSNALIQCGLGEPRKDLRPPKNYFITVA